MFKDVINLVSYVESENEAGDIIKTPSKREVFADKKSVRQSEFYQAAATGLRPEVMFVIHITEYGNEPDIEYNEKTYKIIRTYEKDSEFIELVCQGVVNEVM